MCDVKIVPVETCRYAPRPPTSEKKLSRGIQRGFDPAALKKARLAAGMSVDDLARHAEVSPDAIWRWENATTLPQVDLLRKAAQALRVPLSRIVRVPKHKRMVSDLRVLAGLTKPETGRAANIPTYTYTLVERGLRKPDDSLAERLSKAFGVHPDELLSAWQRAHDRPSGTPA